MTGFVTQCKYCPAQIWMDRSSAEGQWHPMDMTDHNQPHVHLKKQEDKPRQAEQPKEQQTIEPVSPPSGDKKMIKEAEDRVRQIAREEILKFLAEALARYERAKP